MKGGEVDLEAINALGGDDVALCRFARDVVAAIPLTEADEDTVRQSVATARLTIQAVRVLTRDATIKGAVEWLDRMDRAIDEQLAARDYHLYQTRESARIAGKGNRLRPPRERMLVVFKAVHKKTPYPYGSKGADLPVFWAAVIETFAQREEWSTGRMDNARLDWESVRKAYKREFGSIKKVVELASE